MRRAGFSAAELKHAGCTAEAMRVGGWHAAHLLEAGYTVGELHDGGFSATDLKLAGVSAAALAHTGVTATLARELETDTDDASHTLALACRRGRVREATRLRRAKPPTMATRPFARISGRRRSRRWPRRRRRRGAAQPTCRR